MKRSLITLWMAALCLLLGLPTTQGAETVLIGLDADMSSSSALAGIAIERGAKIAINEINEKGGVLGRKLELVVRDHRGNPARGKDNIMELAAYKNLVAILSGLHTPVALAELELIHKNKIIYLSPWATGTPLVDNNYDPNYVFRVSVRDEFASVFLLKEARKRNYKAPCLLLENTGWGRSNKSGFDKAAAGTKMRIPRTQWFNWGLKDFQKILQDFTEYNCDVIMFVGTAREGAHVVGSMLRNPKADRLPIISHWGITGANFLQVAGPGVSEIDLIFLQTYSFYAPTQRDIAQKFIARYFSTYTKSGDVADIIAPAGSAHAYDLVHLLAKAIVRAGTLDRAKVRDALEHLGPHEGLVRMYDKPFTPTRHDALDSSDFRLARFGAKGEIIPVEGLN